jgi:hypothetical protein
MVWVPVTLGV